MSAPVAPSGTVTFLFTDIEESTLLWEEHPDAMRRALARHDALLRQAIEESGGFIFKTVGDAFCAAFSTAHQALAAALTAQQALLAATWETGTPLRVRMALHTGTAEERDGDYFGPTLNRVARLLVIGHGGQVLLSDITHELVSEALPPEVTLRDMGQHRLKDLARPETVFQICHPDLLTEFPPLRSLSTPDIPNNLPYETTSFIGREKEGAEIKALMQNVRLLTLTGAGGFGKTRLSLQVAVGVLDQYPDGVWLVELAPITDGTLVAQTVADVLSVREEPGRPMPRTLEETLRPKRLLLVLDNCEHLLSACASLISDLLRACPHLHVLASSRSALNIGGEQTYPVPSLSLPDPAQAQTVESLSHYEAVRLFIERATLVQPSFIFTEDNAAAVAQICRHLDGIPLAIELAAARVRALAVDQILARLDDRFRLLTGGSRAALPRQQTLRALIDWSYDLLTEPEKILLRRLSVFAGGWTLAASEAVCLFDPLEDQEALDLLTGLVDKSLILFQDTLRGEARYSLLETVRQYARDRLRESGEGEAVRGRHLDDFQRLAAKFQHYAGGPAEGVWLGHLDQEHDNLRAALDWGLSVASGDETRALQVGQMTKDLQDYWYARALFREGHSYAAAFLAANPVVRRSDMVKPWLVDLVVLETDYDTAIRLLDEAREWSQERGETETLLRCLDAYANWSLIIGDLPGLKRAAEESLRETERAGAAGSLAERRLLSLRAQSQFYLAIFHTAQNDWAGAYALCEEMVSAERTLGAPVSLGRYLLHLGLVRMKPWEGQDTKASAANLREGLALLRSAGQAALSLWGIACFGILAGVHQEWEKAAGLCSAAISLSSASGVSFSTIQRAEIDSLRSAACAALGQNFATAWVSGQAMTLDRAVEYALSDSA